MSCKHGANRLTVGVPHARSVGVPSTRLLVVTALVTSPKLLLPFPRTNTSFSVEHRTLDVPVVGSMNVAQVAILACPPGVPRGRGPTGGGAGAGGGREG